MCEVFAPWERNLLRESLSQHPSRNQLRSHNKHSASREMPENFESTT